MFDPALASRCIFCLEDASTARSVAHVISESLIEGAPTLPKGAECDRCNNRLSKVEAKFMNEVMAANLQTTYLSPPIAMSAHHP
jgi:uncharacterized protein with PIN domain